jgi:hypothetical protein
MRLLHPGLFGSVSHPSGPIFGPGSISIPLSTLNIPPQFSCLTIPGSSFSFSASKRNLRGRSIDARQLPVIDACLTPQTPSTSPEQRLRPQPNQFARDPPCGKSERSVVHIDVAFDLERSSSKTLQILALFPLATFDPHCLSNVNALLCLIDRSGLCMNAQLVNYKAWPRP